MRRREFIALFGGTAVACPLATRAEQPSKPVIGYLSAGSPAQIAQLLSALRRDLSELGYVEGQNLIIDYRFAEGQYDRLPKLAAELIQRQVAVIVTGASTPSTLAAKAATATIPIVFGVGEDPVKLDSLPAWLVPEAMRPA